jgi:hypothetical protein
MDNVNIIVMGTFKSGTHSLQEMFSKNNIKSSRIHIEDLIKNTCHFIPIRNQKEIYLSAYFQDINIPSYEYSIFNYLQINLDKKKINDSEYLETEYLNIKKNKNFYDALYKNFINTNWSKYGYLSNKNILKEINKNDITFTKIPFKKNNYTIHKIPNENITIVFMDISILNNIEILNEMFTELQMPYTISQIYLSNIGNEKFYKNEYKFMIEELKKINYFDSDYYDFLDQDIFTVI